MSKPDNHSSAATGYDEPQGYAASLRQQADWVEKARAGEMDSNDIDVDELRAAADFIERLTAVPQTFTMQSDCQCEHPMIKCDQTGCRCTLCGELERLPSSVSRPQQGGGE